MKVTASLKNLRISPRKVRMVADLIGGLDIDSAQVQLENVIKRSSDPMMKLLNSAVANAENNFGLDKNNLYVYEVKVGEGAKLKRWLPRAFGRATLILKRSSNVLFILEERVEGKNRKTKEQMEKEKKDREEARKITEKKNEKEAIEKEKRAEEKFDNELTEIKSKDTAKTVKGGGWVNKVFRRKSG